MPPGPQVRDLHVVVCQAGQRRGAHGLLSVAGPELLRKPSAVLQAFKRLGIPIIAAVLSVATLVAIAFLSKALLCCPAPRAALMQSGLHSCCPPFVPQGETPRPSGRSQCSPDCSSAPIAPKPSQGQYKLGRAWARLHTSYRPPKLGASQARVQQGWGLPRLAQRRSLLAAAQFWLRRGCRVSSWGRAALFGSVRAWACPLLCSPQAGGWVCPTELSRDCSVQINPALASTRGKMP